jgi:hypothetical protein
VRPAADSPSIRPVRHVDSLTIDLAQSVGVEHICLESDEVVVAERVRNIRVGPTFTVVSRLRGCETELAVIEGHRLAVRSRRPRRPPQDYFVDLCFVDGEPVQERRIAWRFWQAGAVLVSLAALGHWLTPALANPVWQHAVLRASIGLLTAAICAGALALYRTRETIAFRSVHGRTRLFEMTGSLGWSRTAKSFIADLARRIEAARASAARSRPHFLRDEMREHRRLWDAGVLSDEAYEAGKQRILHAHGGLDQGRIARRFVDQ